MADLTFCQISNSFECHNSKICCLLQQVEATGTLHDRYGCRGRRKTNVTRTLRSANLSEMTFKLYSCCGRALDITPATVRWLKMRWGWDAVDQIRIRPHSGTSFPEISMGSSTSPVVQTLTHSLGICLPAHVQSAELFSNFFFFYFTRANDQQ